MMVKSQLSKLLNRPLNSGKIDQIYARSLINHTSRIRRAKPSTSFALGACLLINDMSTMHSDISRGTLRVGRMRA